jgi:hypothetical protein
LDLAEQAKDVKIKSKKVKGGVRLPGIVKQGQKRKAQGNHRKTSGYQNQP